jgi:hypothetical protein
MNRRLYNNQSFVLTIEQCRYHRTNAYHLLVYPGYIQDSYMSNYTHYLGADLKRAYLNPK